MDSSDRYNLRDRASAHQDQDRQKLDESSEESNASSRRKHTRLPPHEQGAVFRKPALPASALRTPASGPDSSTNSSQRRKSTFRDTVRGPSGPREFPSPGKRHASSGSTNLLIGDVTNRSFLMTDDTEPSILGSLDDGRVPRGGMGRHNAHQASVDTTDSPLTPANRADDEFAFVPAVNFDDLQDSMARYEGANSLLNEFPGVPSPRSLLKSDHMAGQSIPAALPLGRPPVPRFEAATKSDLNETQDARRRRSANHGSRQSSVQSTAGAVPSSVSQPNMVSLRSRRQSSVPQASLTLGDSISMKAPRKSLGPGVIPPTSDMRKSSLSATHPLADGHAKPTIARNSSINRARRTTIQPSSIGGGAEQNRLSSVLAATTQSRVNKVKSAQLSANDEDSTPTGPRTSRPNQHRANTPSSSGHKRQSTISGRASGLGARTISPTDARRLKRMSMMPAPPMPSAANYPPFTDEVSYAVVRPDALHLTQPSPSLIPRKTTTATPTSARASPDVRASVPSLSSKSSFQSLTGQAQSSSRLPTPKTRQVHSSSAHYNDDTETVPPVPAIPKAFESPKEDEFTLFTHQGKLSCNSIPGLLQDPTLDLDGEDVLGRSLQPTARTKDPGTRSFSTVNRSSTMSSGFRPQPDPAGRKNNNLQPLRLPPLNLGPLSASSASEGVRHPRPSQELDEREAWARPLTPEARRPPKTPSTPMTASKATFFKRQDEELAKQKVVRSSSSHWALRDVVQGDASTGSTQFFDDSDLEAIGLTAGVSIPQPTSRPVITPFTSGSLPKFSGEFGRAPKSSQPHGPNLDERLLDPRQSTMPILSRSKDASVTNAAQPTRGHMLQNDDASPIQTEHLGSEAKDKKEVSNGGMRRRLSLSWKRSSSKASTYQDKGVVADGHSASSDASTKLLKRASEMPPPKIPSTTSTQWLSSVPGSLTESSLPTLVSTGRPSFEAAKRKSTFNTHTNGSSATLASDASDPPSLGGAPLALPKTRNVQMEKPVPTNRSSSWGNFNLSSSTRPPILGRPNNKNQVSAPSLSATTKDKDDLAADDEMRRLSQKRKDVDTAARESEQIKARAIARDAMTPSQALHDRALNLNIFERGEIVDFEKEGVYFTGTKTAKKIIGSVGTSNGGLNAEKSGNHGYDDERGDYNIVLGDHLAYRFEVVDVLGKGSFGQVVRCIDHKHGGVVAVKIIRNKKRFHQQALVEVGILQKLRDWDPEGSNATLSMISSFYFRSHLCIITPCLSINLYELIKAHNFSGFSILLIRRFARQLLSCLVLLQQKRIIHCDLKPENILLCEARKADVRVIDFGSSCREEEKVYTYIQSRFYRSPEVILGSSYGLGIDMWSFGCILAELWTGYPIFPGENEQEQLACIMEIFGPPDKHLVERCTRKKLFFDSVGKPRITVSSKGRRRRPSSKTLAQALKTDDEAFIDFVARCLRWDPDRRMKPNDAINHPFITNQPMSSKITPSDESRRVQRVRATAAATIGPMSSPLKKPAAAQQAPNATPARERARQLPDTPQTTLRAGPLSGGPSLQPSGANMGHSSPNKRLANAGVIRRHSTVATAGSAAAISGTKRASNGTVLASGMGTPSFAQLAAKESMGIAGAQAAVPTKWRA